MPSVPFRHDGWNFLDFPPYAGEWWAVTRHRTVEKVAVDLKDPGHVGKPDLLAAVSDPFIYVFGDAGGKLCETVANRRWTHWQPVLPPAPPLDFDPVASGLADPTPGPRVAEFRTDPGHAVRGPIGLDWRKVVERQRAEAAFEAEQQQAAQDKMDQEDASAYRPGGITPLDLIAAATQLATQVLSLSTPDREAEYRRLKTHNPVLFALVLGIVAEIRRFSGGDRTAV